MKAVGTYIRTLREAHRLSRVDVAVATGTSESQIVRIEAGEQEPRGPLFLKIVNAVRGSADHVMQLVLNESATAEQGQKLAQSWLTEAQQERVERIVTENAPDDIRAAIQQLRDELNLVKERLDSDPYPDRR
ncbi:MAG: helix-turn-helix domain-containing protein [Chloroflexota bacterium]|nr:helix-turn-helix domain-containing protein [Chloroflexota bacterium]